MSTGLPHPEDRLGRYRLVREIGRGAMGIVYEAIALEPAGRLPAGGRAALKLLVFPPLLPPDEREALIVRFAREARALATVQHPYVVRVFDIDAVDGQPYMAMEYLAGQNAREWVLRHGPIPVDAALTLGQQLCAALAAVHAAGIVHRDIKPDNVVLEADGTIRLTDFGIARMEVEASLTRTGGLIGSPAYMAPEQILGGAVDARADLFSTGVTLYQLLTGELPFQGSSIMEVAHRVAYEPPRPLNDFDPILAAVLLKTLEKDPDRRYASAAELGEALREVSDVRRQTPAPTSIAPEQPVRQDRPVPRPGGKPVPGTSGSAALARQTPAALPQHSGSAAATIAGPAAACSRHPQRAAVAWCARCDAPLCGGCARLRRGRAWCAEHAGAGGRPAWITRLEIVGIGLLFALLLWSLYPLRW